MKPRTFAVMITLAALAGVQAYAQHAEPLFEMQVLFDDMRIPKIVVATDGTVLAFASCARNLRRSEDRGKTWQPIQEVGHDAGGGVIVDETTGDVMVITAVKGYLWRSKNHGKTWAREDIVIKPNAANQGSPDTVPASATCSEAGVTLQAGEHKGRLLLPIRVQPPHGNNDQEYWPYNYNTAMYSDDHGKTWQVSSPVQGGTGEGTLAELSTGTVYYNSRSHMSIDHRRQIAWSHDGGTMFVDWSVSEDLFEVGEPFYFKYGTQPSYGCNAGLARLPLESTEGKDVLVFSTPDNKGGDRLGMTVWASCDGAKTWPVKRLVHEGPSAYSSITGDKEGNIYLLFERGDEKLYENLTFVRFNLAWLFDGKDWHSYVKEFTRPVPLGLRK